MAETVWSTSLKYLPFGPLRKSLPAPDLDDFVIFLFKKMYFLVFSLSWLGIIDEWCEYWWNNTYDYEITMFFKLKEKQDWDPMLDL